MGDIDDFFAKKDKKKKGTKKFSKANTEVIAKNLLETEKKELKEMEKQEKELATINTQYSEEKPATTPNSNEDEEWDDYRENKKDYTGLKIESLTVADQPPDEEEEETEINEDGEVVKVKKDESGPWNKLAGSGATEAQQDLIQEPEPSIQTPNVVGGSYVPPQKRGGSGSGGAPSSTEMRRPLPRRNKAAPDINSEVFFPSLSSAQEDTGPKGAWGAGAGSAGGSSGAGGHRVTRIEDVGSFEEVRDRGSQGYSRQAEAPKLALGNKFAALRESGGVGERE